MEPEKNVPMLYRGARALTDDLDNAVLDYVLRAGDASVRRITTEIERPYSTVIVRCLKLEATGFLHNMWPGNIRRRLNAVNRQGRVNVRRHSIERERPLLPKSEECALEPPKIILRSRSAAPAGIRNISSTRPKSSATRSRCGRPHGRWALTFPRYHGT
jgi:hypothetical protein